MTYPPVQRYQPGDDTSLPHLAVALGKDVGGPVPAWRRAIAYAYPYGGRYLIDLYNIVSLKRHRMRKYLDPEWR
jgi:hypothetical protein